MARTYLVYVLAHGNKHRNNRMYLYVLLKKTYDYMTKGQYEIALTEIYHEHFILDLQKAPLSFR